MDKIFEPLEFKSLSVKNRVFRSNIAGRFDNYDGSGNRARINWELKFARGGVGAIISSFVPISIQGRIVPNYATIHRDEHIPFWRELGERVHEFDCRYLMQLSHSGRQRDIPGIEYPRGLSSTKKSEPLHGFQCTSMTLQEIKDVVQEFAQGARRARMAGLDGVELHGANGYLITQFLSSGINDRKDDYGGPLESRARFVLDIVRAIREEVGRDFHLQVKISGTDYNRALFPWERKGNTIEDSIQVCKWLEEAGVDAIHASTGSMFPHPRNPAGGLNMKAVAQNYDIMASSGTHTLRNLLIFRTPLLSHFFGWWWGHNGGENVEGANLADARAIKQAVRIPVICTGGFQTASVVKEALDREDCDAVSIARSLIANNDLLEQWKQGADLPKNPCTYCNKCAVNALQNPLGCYEESRFGSHQEMVEQVMSVFDPPPF